MNLFLIVQFTRQDFVDRYAGSALGFLWAFLHPLALIFIFVVIFSNVMGTRLPGVSSVYAYSIYLVSGLLPWLAFANTINRGSTVFLEKRGIISKVRLSLAQLPLYIVLSESITFLIGLGIFFIFMTLASSAPGKVVLVLPLVFLLQQLLALGLGLLLGVLNVFLRDIKELVTVVMTFWFWLTPIVWTTDIVPPIVVELQSMLNPAFLFVDAYHQMIAFNTLPDWGALLRLALIAGATLTLAYLVLRMLEKDVRDFL